MDGFDVEVKNYRCFPRQSPLRFAVAPGFTSFVGANNAGKSSILKLFWELGPILGSFTQQSQGYSSLFIGGHAQASPRVAEGEQAFSKLNNDDLQIDIAWDALEPDAPTIELTSHKVSLRVGRSGALSTDWRVNNRGPPGGGPYTFDGSMLQSGGHAAIDLQPFFDACAFLAGGMYLGPFRNTINAGGGEQYFDVVIGQQFVGRFHQFKSGPDIAANEAIYRLQEDIKRIFGFDSFDLNADPSGRTLQVFIDGRSFRLTELGSGLAQFILVLANVMVRRPTVVFIDEPESSLHTPLQLDFLTTVASYTTEASVFFATHNLGLARAASERIYSCRRVQLGISEVRPLESTPHLAEFVGELGFSAYRDLGFETIVLVEGPADVRTMQQLLRLWHKDHEVVLLPLGGSSMINANAEGELAEIQRITDRVFVLIDSERAQRDAALSADRQAFVTLCQRLNLPVTVLDRRAIENYFPDQAVKAALGETYRALAPYQLLRDAQPSWGKRDGWRIARQMKAVELHGTDLGDFLASL